MIIPFFIPHAGCPHQCVFCNQRGITGASAPPDSSSVAPTIAARLKTAGQDAPCEVAFYGGSFTALPLEQQRSYLEAVRPFISGRAVSSIRVSTRPDAVSPEIIDMLKGYRVRTVELGAQSLNDRVLRLSGRGHTARDTTASFKLLRQRSCSVGLQLMPGLPGDSVETFSATVDEVVGLRPDFVRIYPALVIKDTPLELLYRRGSYAPLPLDKAVAICADAMTRFEDAGIKVIRVGLQPTEELERPGTVVAGPYHPAFRQLVQSSLFLERTRCLLIRREPPRAEVILCVNPRDLSSAIGQKRGNVRLLEREFGLRAVRFVPDPDVARGNVCLSDTCASRSPGV